MVVALATVSCIVGACGASDEDRIRDTFADLQDAFAARDYDELCTVTTAAAQRHVGQLGHEPPSGNCKREMRRFVGMARSEPVEPARPRIVEVVMDGERATAVIVAGGTSRARVPFVKDGDDWKVDALYGGVPAAQQPDKFRSGP